MGFKSKSDGLGILINSAICINYRTNKGIERELAGGNNAYVTSHNLNTAELALESALVIKDKAFGTNSDIYSAIVNAGYVKNLCAQRRNTPEGIFGRAGRKGNCIRGLREGAGGVRTRIALLWRG